MQAWNMISIKLTTGHKYLDLIIPHFRQMDILIQLMIEIMYSNRMNDSYKKEIKEVDKLILSLQNKEEKINKILKKYKKIELTSQESARILTCYKIARIRMKISYHAWHQGVSVKALIF